MDEKMVKVGCTHPGGLTIRMFGEGKDPIMGGRDFIPIGPKVTLLGPPAGEGGTTDPTPTLEPGVTPVDAEWWARWSDQNRGKNPLLDDGVIFEIKDEGEENPTTEAT